MSTFSYSAEIDPIQNPNDPSKIYFVVGLMEQDMTTGKRACVEARYAHTPEAAQALAVEMMKGRAS